MAYNKFTMAQLQRVSPGNFGATRAVTDTDDYYLDNVGKIVGIILSMLR